MPVNHSQRRDLPKACRDLSVMLTTERRALADKPYWTSPRLISAYLRYFLPWNLVRLTALLPGLELNEPPARPLLLDLGSGPLTLPLALWLSRPDLRMLPVSVLAVDTSPHILNLGQAVFEHMRKALQPDSPWKIHTLKSSITACARKVRGAPWLIASGNVLNELESRDSRAGLFRDQLARFAGEMSNLLDASGYLLAIEPGTRQGGRLICALRSAAMDSGQHSGPSSVLTPLAPCPHTRACPLAHAGQTAWCHLTTPRDIANHAAVAELRDLSREAGLDKDSVSLSFLLLRKRTPPRASARDTQFQARLISEPFALPGYPGRARYACTQAGLALLPDAAGYPAGALCRCRATTRRDGKSGALIVEAVAE